MLLKSVLRSARPYLQGLKVQDAVVGISLIAVELDNGFIGVSYVLREGLKAGCSIFPYLEDIAGTDAAAIGEWAAAGGDDLQKAVGMAVLAAASRGQDLEEVTGSGPLFGIEVGKGDTIGMIGLISPVANMIRPLVKELYIFDEGVSRRGGTEGAVRPGEEQPHLLPTCDVVVISGTAMINGSVDGLLEICDEARDVIMVGASTPMYPEAFLGTKVTVLAGSWWKSECKEVIFKKISLACGIRELGPFSLKKSVRVCIGQGKDSSCSPG